MMVNIIVDVGKAIKPVVVVLALHTREAAYQSLTNRTPGGEVNSKGSAFMRACP
jgi:hypothetical protein